MKVSRTIAVMATSAAAMLGGAPGPAAADPPQLAPQLQVQVDVGSVTVILTNPNDLAWNNSVLCSATLDGHRLNYSTWFTGQNGLPLMVFPAERTEQSLPKSATPGTHVVGAFCEWSGPVTYAPDQTVIVP